MSAKLVVTAGADEGKVFTLSDNTTVMIGRGDTAHIQLADPSVSRLHCSVEYRRGTAILKDNGSKTGTRVNDKPVTEHPLQPDEIIGLGATKLRYQLISHPAKPAVPK